MRKVLVGLAVVCVGFAVLRLAVIALAVATAAVLLFSLMTQPRETLAFLFTLLLFGLASARPVAFIVMFGILALAMVIADARRKPRQQLLLTHGREHRPPWSERLGRDLLG